MLERPLLKLPEGPLQRDAIGNDQDKRDSQASAVKDSIFSTNSKPNRSGNLDGVKKCFSGSRHHPMLR